MHHFSKTPPVRNLVVEKRAARILAAIVIPLLVLTVLGMVWLWPRGKSGVHSQPLLSQGVEQGLVQVVGLDATECMLAGVSGGGITSGVDPDHNGVSVFESTAPASTDSAVDQGQGSNEGEWQSSSTTDSATTGSATTASPSTAASLSAATASSGAESEAEVDSNSTDSAANTDEQAQESSESAASGEAQTDSNQGEADQSAGNAASEGTLGWLGNSDLLGSAVCAKVLQGPGASQVVPVHIPVESLQAVHIGTKIKVLYDAQAIQSGTPFIFWDISRGKSLGILALVYLVLVVAVAGKRGFRALIGLVASTLVLVFFMLPAFMTGGPPLPVTLVGAGAMLFLSVYLAHGITIRTTTALIGTFFGLAITVTFAYWGTWAAGLTGATSDDAQMLITYFPHLLLPSLFTCGAVIAGLGALNDVTITQASAVWELDEANPTMSNWRLLSKAMRIGSDHIASTVYTLAFAYAGTALPTLMLAIMVDRSAIELLTVSELAEEIVRTLVASIGLILAIPATTAIGTILVRASRSKAAPASFSAGEAALIKQQGDHLGSENANYPERQNGNHLGDSSANCLGDKELNYPENQGLNHPGNQRLQDYWES